VSIYGIAATGHSISAGQSSPSSNTTMLQPDRTSGKTAVTRIFRELFFIVWSLLVTPISIVMKDNDPNTIFLRFKRKETN
jgi:hypothetical protein